MKATLLRKAGGIKKGALVEIAGKTGVNDSHGVSTTSAPVYAVTDKDGQTENVDTRDLKVLR